MLSRDFPRLLYTPPWRVVLLEPRTSDDSSEDTKYRRRALSLRKRSNERLSSAAYLDSSMGERRARTGVCLQTSGDFLYGQHMSAPEWHMASLPKEDLAGSFALAREDVRGKANPHHAASRASPSLLVRRDTSRPVLCATAAASGCSFLPWTAPCRTDAANVFLCHVFSHSGKMEFHCLFERERHTPADKVASEL